MRIQPGPVNCSTIQSWQCPVLATKFKAQPLQDSREPRSRTFTNSSPSVFADSYVSPARTYRSSNQLMTLQDFSSRSHRRNNEAITTTIGTCPPRHHLFTTERRSASCTPTTRPLQPEDHPPVRSTHRRLRRHQSALSPTTSLSTSSRSTRGL